MILYDVCPRLFQFIYDGKIVWYVAFFLFAHGFVWHETSSCAVYAVHLQYKSRLITLFYSPLCPLQVGEFGAGGHVCRIHPRYEVSPSALLSDTRFMLYL